MATNYVTASYSEIYDLSTQAAQANVFKVHSPMGRLPRMYMQGFFLQYKKYKYLGMKMTFIPASTLPADPLQISYEAGETTIDPRDMVNPILHKSYHGEALKDDWMQSHMGSSIDVNQFGFETPNTDASSFNFYYQSLQDPSWKKAHVQRGFTAKGVPLVRKVSTNYQIDPGESFANASGAQSQESSDLDWDADQHTRSNGVYNVNSTYDIDTNYGLGLPQEALANSSSNTGIMGVRDPWVAKAGTNTQTYYKNSRDFQMFTSGFSRLGWMDTSQRMIQQGTAQAAASSTAPTQATMQYYYAQRDNFAYLPKVWMHVILMPPAYKTEFYYRIVIQHYFAFKDFRSAMMPLDGASNSLTRLSQQTFIYPTTATMAGAFTPAQISEPDDEYTIIPSVESDDDGVKISLSSVGSY